LAEFLVPHEANIANDSRPFPGAVAALEVLASQGATLAVCTNKREHLSRKLLEELDLTRYFAGLAGRDTFPVSKPDPGHLTGVIALAGGDPSRAVMVGDSETDSPPRRRRGCLPSWSASVMPPPPSTAAEAVIDHFDELPARAHALLNGLPAGRARL